MASALLTDGTFADPGPWHRPANYWFWHRIPTSAEISDQLHQMRDVGYGAFLIAVRLSWPLTDYLSPDYLAAVRTAAAEAARLGLIMGIYDEYNWLSGHAGGRTVADHDALREHHIFWTSGTFTGGLGRARVSEIRATDIDVLLDQGREWVFDGGRPTWSAWAIQSATAWESDGSMVDLTNDAHLVESGPDGAVIEVRPRTGLAEGTRFVVHLSARSTSSRMINYLLPEAAERFIDVGLAPYADALEGYLESTVRYTFFDQPHACFYDWPQRDGHVGASLMYSDGLRVKAEERLPVGWRRALAAVTHGTTVDEHHIRADFFDLYGQTAIDTFFGPLARWCRENQLMLSGHEVLGHVGGWNPAGPVIADDVRTNFAVDYFRLDSHRDMTGVDARNNDPQLSAKFGDSVARRHGRSRCLVEQYYARTGAHTHFAAGQWDLTLAGMRAQAHRHLLLGARQVLQHAFWLTDGRPGDDVFTNPRFDFPPGMNFEPWFAQHRAFADEAARLSVFLDRFEPFTDVALVYPRRSILADGPKAASSEHFAAWARAMSERGVEYRIVDEPDLAAATVEPGAVRCAGASYNSVVIASLSATTSAFVDVLARCAHSVRIVGSGTSVATDESGAERDLRTLASWWAPDGAAPSGTEVAKQLSAPQDRVTLCTLPGDQVTPTWMRAGLDSAGRTCVAALNDSDDMKELLVRLPGGPVTVRRWDLETGGVEERQHRHSYVLALDPQETVALDFRIELLDRIELEGGWRISGSQFDDRVDYERSVDVPAGRWTLVLDESDVIVEVRVNGAVLGQRAWPPYRFPLTSVGSRLTVQLTVERSAAKRYYAGSALGGDAPAPPAGLRGTPVLERTGSR